MAPGTVPSAFAFGYPTTQLSEIINGDCLSGRQGAETVSLRPPRLDPRGGADRRHVQPAVAILDRRVF
jgi:hypothetical protein